MSDFVIEPFRFGNLGEKNLREKWNKLWTQISERLLRLPAKQWEILLEDFLTAIESRIFVMERINEHTKEVRS